MRDNRRLQMIVYKNIIIRLDSEVQLFQKEND